VKGKQVAARFNQALIFLFILLLPTQLGKHLFGDFSYIAGIKSDYLSLTIYLTDIIGLLIIFFKGKLLIKSLRKKQVVVFILLGLINIFFASSRIISTYRWLKIGEFLLLFTIFTKMKVNKKLYLNAFLVGAALETFLATAQFINQRALQGFFYLLGERFFTASTPAIAKIAINGTQFIRPYGTFSHPNSMAGFYLMVGITALIYQPFSKHPLFQKLLFYLSFFLVLISFSKLAIFTFVIIFFIYQLRLFRQKKNCLICWLAKLSLVGSLGLGFFFLHGDPSSLVKRLSLLKISLSIINRHPLFGVGLGNYLIVQNNYPSTFLFLAYQPVHNIFLLGLAELGLIISLIFGKEIYLFIRSNWLTTKIFPYLMAALLITGSFDHYWLTLQQNFLLLSVVLPVAVASSQP